MTSCKFATTLGYERRYNPALQFDNRDEFIAFMVHDQPARPANMINIVQINQGKVDFYPEPPPRIPAVQFQQLMHSGYLAVDTREVEEFGQGHVPGSINIQVTGSEFEQRVGWVAPADTPILLVSNDPAQAHMAWRKLAFVGLAARVVGYLEGGFSAWQRAGLPQQELPQISVNEARQRQEQNGLHLLDVRESSEWDQGHIDGAAHMNFKFLSEQYADLDIQPDQEIVVYCAGGFRANTAASILLQKGYRKVSNMAGGIEAWTKAGLPVYDAEGNRCST